MVGMGEIEISKLFFPRKMDIILRSIKKIVTQPVICKAHCRVIGNDHPDLPPPAGWPRWVPHPLHDSVSSSVKWKLCYSAGAARTNYHGLGTDGGGGLKQQHLFLTGLKFGSLRSRS